MVIFYVTKLALDKATKFTNTGNHISIPVENANQGQWDNGILLKTTQHIRGGLVMSYVQLRHEYDLTRFIFQPRPVPQSWSVPRFMA